MIALNQEVTNMANIEIREKSTKKGREATYKVTVVLGRENGKRIRKSRTYHISDLKHTTPAAQYKEVESLAEAWEKELKGQKTTAPLRADKVKFDDVIPGYNEHIKALRDAGELSRRTASDYISLCELYCLPYFSGKTIEDIDKNCANDFLTYLRDEKNLSPASRKKVLSCMRKVYKYLIENVRLISENPFRDSRIIDRNRTIKSKIGRSWNNEQIQLFAQILTSEMEYYYGTRKRTDSRGNQYEVAPYVRKIKIEAMWRALFLTAITCGFRPGELRGLMWKSIDFDANKIRIVQAVSSIPNEDDEVSTTKSASGVRTIIPSDAAMSALKEWRIKQEKLSENNKIWHGKKLSEFDEQLVFSGNNGAMLDAGSINKKFHKIIDRWNNSIITLSKDELDANKAREYKKMILPRIRAYDLRHTYGTIEAEKGTPANVLAGKMGHNSPTTTFDNYIHSNRNVFENHPNQFNDIISVDESTGLTERELVEKNLVKQSIDTALNKLTTEQLEKVLAYIQKL